MFLHDNFRTVGVLPREGFIPVGEQESAICEAESQGHWYEYLVFQKGHNNFKTL